MSRKNVAYVFAVASLVGAIWACSPSTSMAMTPLQRFCLAHGRLSGDVFPGSFESAVDGCMGEEAGSSDGEGSDESSGSSGSGGGTGGGGGAGGGPQSGSTGDSTFDPREEEDFYFWW